MNQAFAVTVDGSARKAKLPMPLRVSMMAGASLMLWSVILVPFLA